MAATATASCVDTCRANRQPLEYLRRAPVAIRTLNPKFEERFKARGDFSIDAKEEREAERKLKRQHRKELRGAGKELRKDAAALGKARLDQWKAMRARDESKKNEIMGFLESQQSEFGQGKKKRHKK